VALTKRSNVRADGKTLPLSRRATTACVAPHGFGNLFLRHVRIGAGFDHGGCEGELRFKGAIGRNVPWVSLPLLERLFDGDEFLFHWADHRIG